MRFYIKSHETIHRPLPAIKATLPSYSIPHFGDYSHAPPLFPHTPHHHLALGQVSPRRGHPTPLPFAEGVPACPAASCITSSFVLLHRSILDSCHIYSFRTDQPSLSFRYVIQVKHPIFPRSPHQLPTSRQPPVILVFPLPTAPSLVTYNVIFLIINIFQRTSSPSFPNSLLPSTSRSLVFPPPILTSHYLPQPFDCIFKHSFERL